MQKRSRAAPQPTPIASAATGGAAGGKAKAAPSPYASDDEEVEFGELPALPPAKVPSGSSSDPSPPSAVAADSSENVAPATDTPSRPAAPMSPASNRDRFRSALMPAQVTCDLSTANTDPGLRFSFQGIVLVIFPASQSPIRRHVLIGDGRGVVGVTVWNAHVAAFSVSTVGQMVRMTKVSLSSYNGTRGISLNKESTLTFGEDNDHFAHVWWQELPSRRPLQAIDFAEAQDNTVVNVAGILGSVHVESKTVRSDAKELLTLRLVDRTGIIQIRSWNHVASEFSAKLDQPIMISRVRVSSFGGMKIGELLDGTGSIVHQDQFSGSVDLAKFWSE